MPVTTNMLQAYWVDYEVWFRESSAWKYRNWVERYLVMPPFTQHADAPQHDTAGHGHHAEPVYEKVTGFQPSVDVPDLPEEDEKRTPKRKSLPGMFRMAPETDYKPFYASEAILTQGKDEHGNF